MTRTTDPLHTPGPVRPRIHGRGNERLDGVLDFVTFAAKPMPLASLLDEAPQRLAAILKAEVVSLYLLEGDGDTLVMRGNVGFTALALGQVRLRVGEGLTGTAVETLRPVSVATAARHAGYRYFPELGEDDFPVFAAVPIFGRKGALGAVVVQRRDAPFEDPDLELLTALAAAIAAGVRAAELIDSLRERGAVPSRRTGGNTRRVILPGRPVVPGRALGAVAAVKRPPAHPRRDRSPDDVPRLKAAFDVADKAIRALSTRAEADSHGADASFLGTYAQIVSDARLREEALRLCAQGLSVAESLGDLARRVVRTAAGERSAFLEERARDIEDLCDALTMLATSDPRAELPRGALLVADQLTVFDILISSRSRPVGVALSEPASGPRTRVLLSLLGLPAVADVGGLFRWIADGDIALVDAHHGLVVINPSRAEVAAVRKARRDSVSTDAPVDDDDLGPNDL